MTAGITRGWAGSLGLVIAYTAVATVGWVPGGTGSLLIVAATVLALLGPALAVGVVGVPVSAPSMLFTGALVVFHLGLVAPWAAGWEDAPLWLANAPIDCVDQALRCVILALAGVQLGTLVGWRRFDRRPPRLTPTIRDRRAPSALYTGGIAVAVMAALAALANIQTIGFGAFFGSAYGHEVFDVNDSRLLQTCLFWALPAGTLMMLAGARRGIEARRGLMAIGAMTLLLLWLGDRGDAVALAAAALVVRTYTHGAISVRAAAPAAVGLLAVIALVAVVRQLPRNSVTSAELRDAAASATPIAALAEMGWTLRPLVETIRLVPAQMPYRGGQSYLDAAARLLPNLTSTRADADWTDPLRLPPNHWITFTVEPWTHAAFGGLGFSAIAEPYLNFGVGGVVVYFVLLGLALGRLDVWLATAPPRRVLATAALVFMPLLLTARNDYHNFVRPALWGVALVFLIEQLHGVRSTPSLAAMPTGRLA